MDRYFCPLSGNYISQSTAMVMATVTVMASFRPLSGNYISQLTMVILWLTVKCFRPLSGNYISQSPAITSLKNVESFRPLSGNYISQWSWGNYRGEYGDSFRPLSGNYISQYGAKIVIAGIMAYTVSVPYRGTTFLTGEKWFVSKLYVGFPSPIGELHFSIRYYLAMYQEQRKMFPSPIGELHFSMCGLLVRSVEHGKFPSPIGELHFSIRRIKQW